MTRKEERAWLLRVYTAALEVADTAFIQQAAVSSSLRSPLQALIDVLGEHPRLEPLAEKSSR